MELVVLWVIPERDDRNAIVYLKAEAVDSVVDEENVLQVKVIKDSQILDVNASSGILDAWISVETVMNDWVVRIDIV